MQIIKLSDVPAEVSADKIFRGEVKVQRIMGQSEDELRAIVVNFSPGSRNIFHTHTFGQILYVTEGKGVIATEHREVTVTPGTLIFIPAGEKHWHGATRDSSFAHIAIMPPGQTKY
jgi:quercetin dioxygenase-like cupin family protein